MSDLPFSVRRKRLFSSWGPPALYAALLSLSFGVCGAAYLFFPELRAKLVLEDGLIENLSVSFYLLGTGLLLVGRSSRTRHFRGMLVLAALCFVGALEELSYGQRLFPGLQFPTLPSGMTFDALHDLDRIVVKQFERLGVPWYVGFLLSAFILLGLAAWLLRHRLGDIFSAVSAPRSAWLYVSLAAGLAAAALFIDSRGSVPQKWTFLEEVLELNAALSLMLAAGVSVFFAPRAVAKESEVSREA